MLKERFSLLFLRQKLRNNYKLGIRGSAFLEESLFQRVPFSVPALIFEPIKLWQEWSFAECNPGESNDSSRWANTEIGRSHQKLIKLVWCVGGTALVAGGYLISQTKWAWCVSFRVGLPWSSKLVLQAAAHTVKLILTEKTSAHCSS